MHKNISKNIYKTKIIDKTILSIEGKDKVEFLQNLISNNMELVSNTKSIYSTLLNPQGKFLFDFIIFKGNEKESLYLECDKNRSEELIKLLNMYKLRKDVKFSVIENITIYLIYGEYQFLLSSFNLKHTEGSTSHMNNNIFLIDPRNKKLGIRLYSNNDKLPAEISDIGNKSIKNYETIRINLVIPDSNKDLEVGKSFLLENNFEIMNAIDFNKGCYIGQENTARQKYRGTAKKLLTKIEIEGKTLSMGNEIKLDNRKVGVVRSITENIGLATIRREVYEEYKSKNKYIKIAESKIKFIK